MRKRLFGALSLPFSFLLYQCVGDDPGTGSSDAGATSDAGGGTDATVSNDAGNSDSGARDSGADGSGPIGDQCIGHTDCPSEVESANLQLWLRANAGLNCSGGHVAVWNDQSGKGHNAMPPLRFDAGTTTAATPQCGVDMLSGIGVVTFSDPAEPDAGAYTQFVDETLDVDTSNLRASDYTVFIVDERRGSQFEWLLGFDRSVPPGTLQVSCGVSDQEDCLGLGFELPSGMQAIGYSQVCSGGNGPGAATSTAPELIELVFSAAIGHSLYLDGANVYTGSGSGGDLEGITNVAARHGTIGRAFNLFNESRFKGTVAEIIAYDAALTPSERGQIEAYLKRQWGLTF